MVTSPSSRGWRIPTPSRTLRAGFFIIGLLVIATPAGAFVLGPTAPGNWGGPGATVTYSFMATGVNYDETSGGGTAGTITALGDFMPAGWQAQIVAALNAWSAVAGITFVQVPDLGEDFNAVQQSGDIRFGGHAFDGANGTLAHGYYPPNNGLSAAGDIHFDIAETWKIGFGGAGFDIFQVAAHEIGHAIGLDHTAVPNSLMNPIYTEAFSGPQADDIAGAQALFGAGSGGGGGATPEPTVLGLFAVMALGLYVTARRPGLHDAH